MSIAVVGGGISGLVTAWHLVTHLEGDERPTITVYEAGDRVGGKLRQETIGGHRVDVGAESALWRRPEVVDLLTELGVDAVHPQRFPAMLWSRGRLEALPGGTLMGIPSDPRAAAGLLDDAEIARALDERPVSLHPDGTDLDDANPDSPNGDITVGDAVEQALGSAVVDRMVEPLLGGVYAGHARQLSAHACVPALYAALRAGTSLTKAAAAASSAVSSTDTRQVFGAPAGGMGSLPQRLAQALRERGVDIVTGAEVTRLQRSLAHRGSWQLDVEIDGLNEPRQADAVVLAAPAPVTAALLGDLTPAASQALAGIEYASMALVTYAFPAELTDRLPQGTGFLVPPIDGRTIKASTFSSVKWPWLAEAAPDVTYVRVSLGRHGESAVLERSDDDLARAGLADLEAALGIRLPTPLDTHVQRWDAGLPQYALGHLDRVAGIEDDVAELPGVEIVGAALGGVGIPACVATARGAADRLVAYLRARPTLTMNPTEGAGR